MLLLGLGSMLLGDLCWLATYSYRSSSTVKVWCWNLNLITTTYISSYICTH